MCTLLGHVLPRVSNAVLRSKFVGCSQVISGLTTMHRDKVRVVE
jgi:hypothetical protein